MKKIPTLFQRDWNGDRRNVLPTVTAGCEWVLAGEGTPTRKYDGMCAQVSDGRLFRRHEVKAGKQRPPLFLEVETDEETGNVVGWVPVEDDAPADKYFCEAWAVGGPLPDGTYELIGPKVQGNPEGSDRHRLIAHANAEVLADAPRTFDELGPWLHAHPFEGIVWHHPDGRMAKIKRRDFPLLTQAPPDDTKADRADSPQGGQ